MTHGHRPTALFAPARPPHPTLMRGGEVGGGVKGGEGGGGGEEGGGWWGQMRDYFRSTFSLFNFFFYFFNY